MPETLRLGPLALPVPVLLLFLAFGLATWVGHRLGRKRRADLETPALVALVVGVVAARAAFVLGHLSDYREAPWRMLDIRDGGWLAPAGLLAVWLSVALSAWRRPALRMPLLVATLTGSGIWLAGQVALALGALDERPLPALQVQTLDGVPFNLGDLAGTPTVVNLWATWCPPCRREMPVLERAQREHPDIRIVLLNQGESADTVRRYLASEQLQLRDVLLDGGRRFAGEFGVTALPTTLFFDRRGRLAAIRVGELSSATLAARLRAIR